MWSRLNVEGLRARWAVSDNEVTWSTRSSASRSPVRRKSGGSGGSGRSGGQADKRIQRQFMARETIIDCPHPGCLGIYLTGRREIHRPPGTGARVVLRCTRQPSEHESSLFMPAYSTEEREALKAALLRKEEPRCARCATALELGKVDAPGVRGTRAEGAAPYYCPWCGVKWVPPS